MDIQQIKSDFDRDGFVILRNFLSEAEVQEFRERGAAIMSKARNNQIEYRNSRKELENFDEFFRDLMHHGRHLEILETLIGEKPVPGTAGFEDSTVGFFDKETDEEIPPHPDSDNGATVWFSLDPTRPDNGCVHYLRGSHVNPDDIPYLKPDFDGDLFDHPDAVPAIMEPGDVAIHNCRTIHWSRRNTSGEPRRGINIFYQRFNGEFFIKYAHKNVDKYTWYGQDQDAGPV